ncbi:LysR family transcriptional regulator [Chromobacterium haemolyticum]|uniref:LysR family transcriptional regulator n=1 Tax=Chromobacterium TaxID=535 RepID=UPI004057461A
MKLSQLNFFCAVVEQGSIAAAAEQLHRVPSNLTARLQELEAELGVKLFSRENRRLLPTPEGLLLYRHARGLLRQADEVGNLFAGAPARGLLRVGALEGALVSHLPARIARYRRQQPEVELHLRAGHSLLLERQLQDGELDLILSDGPVEHPLLTSRLAFREKLMLISPPNTAAPTAEALAGLELYTFGAACHYRRLVEQWLQASGVRPRAVLEIESYPAIFACVAAGAGFSCVPESLCRPQDGYRGFALPDLAISDIHFIWRKQQESALVDGFIQSIATD